VCIYIYIYIYVNWNWADSRWQQYSTHLHTNNTQNNTINNLIGKSAGRTLSLRLIPWHLLYNWGKSADKPQSARKNLSHYVVSYWSLVQSLSLSPTHCLAPPAWRIPLFENAAVYNTKHSGWCWGVNIHMSLSKQNKTFVLMGYLARGTELHNTSHVPLYCGMPAT